MATPPLPAATPDVPREIECLAEARGVGEFVPVVLETTRRLYPSRRITCRIDRHPEDDEVEDYFIRFDVDVAGLTPEQPGDTQRAWCREMVHLCPAPLGVAFRLGWQEG
jgi:hypothetical protein